MPPLMAQSLFLLLLVQILHEDDPGKTMITTRATDLQNLAARSSMTQAWEKTPMALSGVPCIGSRLGLLRAIFVFLAIGGSIR